MVSIQSQNSKLPLPINGLIIFLSYYAQFILILFMNNIEPSTISPKPARKKDPCRKQQIDFHLCEKKYGFNDQYCKYYLQLYQGCAKANQSFYHDL